jgi:hypothetical protein
MQSGPPWEQSGQHRAPAMGGSERPFTYDGRSSQILARNDETSCGSGRYGLQHSQACSSPSEAPHVSWQMPSSSAQRSSWRHARTIRATSLPRLVLPSIQSLVFQAGAGAEAETEEGSLCAFRSILPPPGDCRMSLGGCSLADRLRRRSPSAV